MSLHKNERTSMCVCAHGYVTLCVYRGGSRGHPPAVMLNRTIVERRGGFGEMKGVCVGGVVGL